MAQVGENYQKSKSRSPERGRNIIPIPQDQDY